MYMIRRMWDAVDKSDLESAKKAYARGTCLELESKMRSSRIRKLDEALWDAVDKSDLESAKKAYASGTCSDLFYERPGVLLPYKEYIVEGDFNSEDMNAYEIEPHVVKMGLMTLMRSSQNNAVHIIEWLCDVGCDVNAVQPNSYIIGDGYEFGGLTALICATSYEAIQFLACRGAYVEVRSIHYDSNMFESVQCYMCVGAIHSS